MTARAELTRRAQQHGVAVSFQDWRGRLVEVPDETLAAVLSVLEADGALAESRAPGAGRIAGDDATRDAAVASHARAFLDVALACPAPCELTVKIPNALLTTWMSAGALVWPL